MRKSRFRTDHCDPEATSGGSAGRGSLSEAWDQSCVILWLAIAGRRKPANEPTLIIGSTCRPQACQHPLRNEFDDHRSLTRCRCRPIVGEMEGQMATCQIRLSDRNSWHPNSG
jgi:hypothetical protein